jgi:hypothetical protein
MLYFINLPQTCSLSSKGRVGVGWGHLSYIVELQKKAEEAVSGCALHPDTASSVKCSLS